MNTIQIPSVEERRALQIDAGHRLTNELNRPLILYYSLKYDFHALYYNDVDNSGFIVFSNSIVIKTFTPNGK